MTRKNLIALTVLCLIALWATSADIILFAIGRLPWHFINESPPMNGYQLIWQSQSYLVWGLFAFCELSQWGLSAARRWQAWLNYAIVNIGLMPMSVALTYVIYLFAGHYHGVFGIMRALLLTSIILAGKYLIWRYSIRLVSHI